MNKVYLPHFNHEITLVGGQSFSWDALENNAYLGVTQDRAIKVIFNGDYMHWQTYPQNNDLDFITKYFWLDVEYENILDVICKDKHVKIAMESMPDIRILRQPLDLTVFSFIISANNNIKAIRKSFRSLSRLLGKKISVEGEDVYLFPDTEAIANCPREKLIEARVGFRADYLQKSAKMLLDEKVRRKICCDDEDCARAELMQLPGVGNKVADCVLVFSLGFQNITPVDVWAKRFLTELYELPDNWSYDKFRQWIKANFYGYASWADQFLFEWYRKQPRK